MKNKYLYRILRLRRLALASMAIVFAGLFAGEALFGTTALLADPIVKTCIVAACLTAVFGLILAYPHVWWETICAALVLGLLLMLLPFFAVLPNYMPRDEGIMALFWVIFIVVFGGIFLWLGLFLLMLALYVIPSYTMRDKSRISTGLPVEKAFEILKLKPDFDDGFHRSGPVESDGFFTVSLDTNTFEPNSYLPVTETLSIQARIEEEGPHYQIATYAYDVDQKPRHDVQTLVVRKVRGKTRCEAITQKSESNLFESIGFWMQDYGSDHLMSHLIKAQGGKSNCIRDLPYRSPIYDLARYFDEKTGGARDRKSGY